MPCENCENQDGWVPAGVSLFLEWNYIRLWAQYFGQKGQAFFTGRDWTPPHGWWDTTLRPLQNAPFCPIYASGSTLCTKWSFSFILEIHNVFMWLKFSPSLNSNKNEHFSKVSMLGNDLNKEKRIRFKELTGGARFTFPGFCALNLWSGCKLERCRSLRGRGVGLRIYHVK